jgi:hypothetical protein
MGKGGVAQYRLLFDNPLFVVSTVEARKNGGGESRFRVR